MTEPGADPLDGGTDATPADLIEDAPTETATQASGCSPSGAISAKWQQFESILGPCVDDEHDDGAGGRIETFKNGYIDWTPSRPAEAFEVHGGLAEAWMAVYGGPAGTGQPLTDQEAIAPFSPAAMNTFQKVGDTLPSYLVWNPGYTGETYDGAQIDWLPCQEAYQVCQIGGGIGWIWFNTLGAGNLPTSNEVALGLGSSPDRVQTFDDESSLGAYFDEITWSAETNDLCYFRGDGYSFSNDGNMADCADP